MTAAVRITKPEGVALVAATALAALTSLAISDVAAASTILTLGLVAVTAWIVVQDLRTFTISDAAIVALAALALASRFAVARATGTDILETTVGIVLDAVLMGGVLFLFREVYFRWKGYDGLGLGDVKLTAAGAILVGIAGFSWALFIASLLALGFVAMSRVGGGALAAKDKLAFGAALAPAVLLMWIIEQMPMIAALVEP